jgi:hypothetical protein
VPKTVITLQTMHVVNAIVSTSRYNISLVLLDLQ